MERSSAQQLAIDEAVDLDRSVVAVDSSIDVDELIDRSDTIDVALFHSAPLQVSDELDEATRRVTLAERRLSEADDHQWHARTDGVAEARAQLDQYAAMRARFDDWTRGHQDDLVDRRILDAQIKQVLTEQIVAVEHDPTVELVEALGHPPMGVDARAEWRAAAVAMAIDARRTGREPDAETRPTIRHKAMELK